MEQRFLRSSDAEKRDDKALAVDVDEQESAGQELENSGDPWVAIILVVPMLLGLLLVWFAVRP